MAKKPAQPAVPVQPRFPSYKAVAKHFSKMPEHVQRHFPHLTDVLDGKMPLEIPIAYLFLNIELACNRSLYGGVVRLHRVDSTFARRIIHKQHLTREGFRDLFFSVFGEHPAGQDLIERAEKIRDKVIHGKKVDASALRECIGDALDFCSELHTQVQRIANLTPFADMRGFTARRDQLDPRTSKWVMKGMGFGVR